MSTHILFGLRLDSFILFWKTLEIVTPSLSCNGKTDTYLLKILVTHNNKRIPLLNLLINYKLARAVLFRFSNFLIVGLCNFSASFITTPPAVFLSKNLQTIEASLH